MCCARAKFSWLSVSECALRLRRLLLVSYGRHWVILHRKGIHMPYGAHPSHFALTLHPAAFIPVQQFGSWSVLECA